jgi:putative membrane protein
MPAQAVADPLLEDLTMWTDALLAYAHYASILMLAGYLLCEYLLLRRKDVAPDPAFLVRVDIGYCIAAAAVLSSGAGRLFFGVKPAAFYLGNPVFHAKIGLFVLLGLLSIVPTRAFLRWRRLRRADPAWALPAAEQRRVRLLVLIELHLVALLPLLAALMARGIGYRG